ncbi:MAG: diguanylate cyclase [Firmicutes bacterium]|nr:diguanylate cyclase [Bacillota bacterium]
MSLLHHLLKHIKLDDNNEIDLQFGVTTVCIWTTILSFCYAVFFLFTGLFELGFLLTAIFVGSCIMLFLCQKSILRIYASTYVFISISCAYTHIFITYYLGGCGTLFLVVTALISNHMYPLLKSWGILLMDVFLLLVINIAFWLSLNNIPLYGNILGEGFRFLLTNISLLTCLIVLYINVINQEFIKKNRQSLIDKAAEAAVLDALTGLGNRRMLERYRTELEVTSSEAIPLSIAVLDIDYFKVINDTYGHAFGDNVLKYIAYMMQNFFRDNDILIRWGGEEFLVLLRNTGLKEAENLMNSFWVKMQNTSMLMGSREIRVQLTIGLHEHISSMSIEDSIRKADELMYQGKLQGRNRIMLG